MADYPLITAEDLPVDPSLELTDLLLLFGGGGARQAALSAFVDFLRNNLDLSEGAVYLGAHANDASATAYVDGAPSEGQLYWNTTAKEMRVWDLSAWQVFSGVADGSVTKAKLAADAVPPIYPTAIALSDVAISPSVKLVRVSGQGAEGDGEGGEFIDVDNGSLRTVTSGDGRTWYRTNINRRRYVDVGDYCPLDDTVDATAAVQAALNDGEGREVVFSNPFGGKRTYKVTSTLTPKPGTTLINGGNTQIDFSVASTEVFTGTLFKMEGSMEADVAVTAAVAAGDETIPVASTAGFAKDDYVYLSSTNNLWDVNDDLTKRGELHKIKSLGAGTLTFYEPVLYPMTSVIVTKINYLDHVRMEGIKAFGKADSASRQFGADIRIVKDAVFEDCDFTYFEDRCFWIWRCLNPHFRGGKIGHCRSPGRSYGITFGGATYYAKVSGTYFLDCRHGIDYGDIYGVSRYGVIQGTSHDHMRETALSTHTASDHLILDGNTMSCTPSDPLSGGILIRSINTTIVNNRISRPNLAAIEIIAQPLFDSQDIISGNIITDSTAMEPMIRWLEASGGGAAGVTITNNQMQSNTGLAGSAGVEVRTQEGVMNRAVIANNIAVNVDTGVRIRADNAAQVGATVINGNILTVNTGGTGVEVRNTGTGNIANTMTTNNIVRGSSVAHGYREVNEGGGAIAETVVIGNNFQDATTKTTVVATVNVVVNNLV